jgi:PPK2 family polyphosphate:nucleotide phosphotransferase
MKLDLDLTPYRFTGKGKLSLKDRSTALPKHLYTNDDSLAVKLSAYRAAIDGLQQKMYADDRHALLLIFQAMDASGKDGTIRHVMSGVNPHGVTVHAFKRPSEDELDHHYLWRTSKVLPARGTIGIFNRSYYEEVLVVRVHPEILTTSQRLPESTTQNLDAIWEQRFTEIANYEKMLTENGTHVAKFYLHVSREEQKKRFLERIATPAKNWKFNLGDVKERSRWKDYRKAYEAAIMATATKASPWYIVPADDKGDMRLIVSAIILQTMEKLGLEWPTLPTAQKAELAEAKKLLLAEDA